MTRFFILGTASVTLLLSPGCIAMTAADLAIGATGAVVGTAGEVVEGAVDVVTPGDKAAPQPKIIPIAPDLDPAKRTPLDTL